nr:hypothetical protein [Listeria welshimeri]
MEGACCGVGFKFLRWRTFREGLHARFTRMYIWAVTRFASNGSYGIELV